MKQAKIQILLTMLFIAVGIAAVTTNLIGNVNTPIASNTDDFLVYFSSVLVDGKEDLSLVKSDRELVFDSELSAVGDKKIVVYDVTNASKNYDARISITCTGSNDYLKVTNSFDEKNDLTARSTKSGTLTVELINAVSTEATYEVKCTISASAVERESVNDGYVMQPAINPYVIGHEVAIGDELFNVIEVSDTEVQLFAMSALNDEYRQDEEVSNGGWFSGGSGWSYSPGPKEIDIQSFDGHVKIALNNYFDYINTVIPVNKVDLITLKQIENLGCTIPSDYAYSADISCDALRTYAWWSYGVLDLEYWWTKSAVSNKSNEIWMASKTGLSKYVNYATIATGLLGLPGVRPVITVDRSVYAELVSSEFELVINGDTYTFFEGMTWRDWVESSYNTTNASIDSSGYVNIDNWYYLFIGPDLVFADDLVDRNSTYEFADGFQ